MAETAASIDLYSKSAPWQHDNGRSRRRYELQSVVAHFEPKKYAMSATLSRLPPVEGCKEELITASFQWDMLNGLPATLDLSVPVSKIDYSMVLLYLNRPKYQPSFPRDPEVSVIKEDLHKYLLLSAFAKAIKHGVDTRKMNTQNVIVEALRNNLPLAHHGETWDDCLEARKSCEFMFLNFNGPVKLTMFME